MRDATPSYDPPMQDYPPAAQWGPQGAQTPMRLYLAENWPAPTEARFRRVGWLDQKGRVWTQAPPSASFDGGSLTPLLIQLDED